MTVAASGAALVPIGLALTQPDWPALRIATLAAAIFGGLLVGFAVSKHLARTLGPRHLLQALLVAETLFLVVPVLASVLALPSPVFFIVATFLGAAFGGVWQCDLRLRRAYPFIGADLRTIPLVAATIATAVGTFVLSEGVVIAFGALTIVAATCIPTVGKIQDPVVPGPSPFAPYLPWRDPGTARPTGKGWWIRFPAHLVYSLGTLVLFSIWVIVFDADRERVPNAVVWAVVYEIPNLIADVPRTIVNFATGVWFNHHPVQLVYVFALFALFGIWFEIHEGTRRAVAVFYGTSIFAGVSAGLLLHLVRPFLDAAWVEEAWTHAWNGGSAGAFGLAGGYIARARKPWLLASILLFWELNVELWHLRSYTVAFHVAALAGGFAWVRYAMPPHVAITSREAVSD